METEISGLPNPMPNVPMQVLTPATGNTVGFNDNSADQLLYIKNAVSLAGLNVNLPSDAKSGVGQLCYLAFRRAITLLTVDQIGGGATVLNGPTAAIVGSYFIFQKVEPNTWVCQ